MAQELHCVFSNYQEASHQKIHFGKLDIFFSRGVIDKVKVEFLHLMPINITTMIPKHLGFVFVSPSANVFYIDYYVYCVFKSFI